MVEIVLGCGCSCGGIGDILRFLYLFPPVDKRLVNFFLSYDKTECCDALKIFPRKEGVLSCPLYAVTTKVLMQETRIVLKLLMWRDCDNLRFLYPCFLCHLFLDTPSESFLSYKKDGAL